MTYPRERLVGSNNDILRYFFNSRFNSCHRLVGTQSLFQRSVDAGSKLLSVLHQVAMK